jgi:hypothetical protein
MPTTSRTRNGAKVVPYGVYDVGANRGYVSLGIDHDTAQFAVNAARLWLDKMGRERYPDTRRVMITAGCRGSNGPRLRLWKVELQRLADQTGLTFQVCHYPKSAIILPAPRSGTRLSTACSATSHRTGAPYP